MASKTRALVYHVPTDSASLADVAHFEWTLSDLLLSLPERETYLLMANTSRATTARQAVEKALVSLSIFHRLAHAVAQRQPVIKLEVLREDLTTDDAETVAAASTLLAQGLEVVPLVAVSSRSVKACADAGVPFARLLVGRIGGLAGIENPELVRQVVEESQIPLFFEGGIATPDHVQEALSLGASGVLVNSAFHANADPAKLCTELRGVIDAHPRRIQAAQFSPAGQTRV